MSTVVDHPAAALMAAVRAERAVADAPEAEALQNAIYAAVAAYYEYLDRSGLFFDHSYDPSLLKASALVVTCDMLGAIEIKLKDGAIDRRYGDGENPDPFETLP